MRALLEQDVDLALLCLIPLAPEVRPQRVADWLTQAHAADKYRKRHARRHPLWGDGTLAGRLQGLPHAQPLRRHDDASVQALLALAQGLHLWRTGRERHGKALIRKENPRIPAAVGGKGHGGHSNWRCDDFCARIAGKGALRMVIARKQNLAELDPVWHRICEEAREAIQVEPLMGGLIHSGILHHATFEGALAYRLALKLSSNEMSEQILREIADAAYEAAPELVASARADIVAIFDRDPACHRYLQPLLYFKGFQAVQAYRLGHWLWQQNRRDLAYFVQMRVSECFGVDIHPAARIGKGIMIDHAHSIVIGETAVVGDNVSMLHSVTLGGTGKSDGDRHPKIGDGVLIGAGAKVLGNITVGHCSKIAAGSVVLQEVPPCTTVAGVPARVVGDAGCAQPASKMDQMVPS